MKKIINYLFNSNSAFSLVLTLVIFLTSFFFKNNTYMTHQLEFYQALDKNTIWQFMAIIICSMNFIFYILSFLLPVIRFRIKYGSLDSLNFKTAIQFANSLGRFDRLLSMILLLAFSLNNLTGLNTFDGLNIRLDWFLIISLPALLILIVFTFINVIPILWPDITREE